MKRVANIVVRVLVGLLAGGFAAIFIVPLLYYSWQSPKHTQQAIDTAYTTVAYDVDIALSSRNVYTVTETIDVDFLRERHGLIRYIPNVGYLDIDGRSVPFRAKITQVSVEGWQVSTAHENGNTVLQIGSADTTVSGPQRYVIHYTYDMGTDAATHGDAVLFNVMGTEWATDIASFTFHIRLPAPIDAQQLRVYSGAYGERAEGAVACTVQGDVLTGGAQNLAAYNGVTVYCPVPESYFQDERGSALPVYFAAVLVLLALGCGVLWYVFARDKRFFVTPEFYPPDGIDPARAGYLVDGVAEDRDLISLIFYWANMGLLTIEPGGKHDFVFTRTDADYRGQLRSYERALYNGIFATGATVTLSQLKGQLGDAFEDARKKLIASLDKTPKKKKKGPAPFLLVPLVCMLVMFLLMPRLMENVLNSENFELMYSGTFIVVAVAMLAPALVMPLQQLLTNDKNGDTGTTVFTRRSRIAQNTSALLAGLPLPLAALYCIWRGGLARHTFCIFVLWILFAVLAGALRDAVDCWPTRSRLRNALSVARGVCIVLVLGMCILTAQHFYAAGGMMTLAAACSMVGLCFMLFTKQRTDAGRQYLGKLLGLRRFIQLAEKHRIELLVQENPNYFYDVLPYAYALGVTEVWCKKFAGLAMAAPAWCADAADANDFDRSMRGATTAISAVAAVAAAQSDIAYHPTPFVSTGGGGSWSGGGSSGGGGGGSSSGGGGGGGGGHSW